MNPLMSSQGPEFFTATVEKKKRNFVDLVEKREGEGLPKPVIIDLVGEECPPTLEQASQLCSAEDNGEEMVVDPDDQQFDEEQGSSEPEEEDDEDAPVFNPQVWPPQGEANWGGNTANGHWNAEIAAQNRKYVRQLKRERELRNEQEFEQEVQPRMQLDAPDLDAYFAQWPQLEDFPIIAMCRTFANAKAQKMRIANSLNGGLESDGPKKTSKKTKK